jgi:archaellum biogenesis ATPase FlaH
LIRQLYELSESRNILYTIKNIVKNIDSFNIEKVKQKFKYLSRDRFETDEVLSGNYLDDYEARLKAIDEKTEEGEILIPTGISKFDWQIGGIMPGEFGVIIGRTGLGKTAMLVCMALHAWLKGFNVAFATGEMRKILIQYRMDSNIAHIMSDKFRTGKFEMEDLKKWADTIDGLRQVCDSYLEVGSFSRNFNTDNLEDWLHKLNDKHGKPVDVLFVDYLNIMDATKSKKDRGEWQSQANAVWDLKTLSETYNEGRMCVWTAGQIKDEFYNAEKLTLEAAKYARAISETAPIICGLIQTEDDILYNTMQLQILKMRNAPPSKDSILLHPDLNFMRINDKAKSRYKSLFDLDLRPKKKKTGGKKRSLYKND